MEFHCFGDPAKPVLVLIHGVMTPWQIWEPHIEHFSADYRVIVPALDAHIAEHPSEFVSLDDECVQIEQYLEQNCGGKVSAICGLSMGGLITNRLFERGKVQMSCIVLDGAPLITLPRIAEWFMTRSYCSILRKVKQREPKVLKSFQRDFLPERFLPMFLPFADTMTESSIRNMMASVWRTAIQPQSGRENTRILFLHGTEGSEAASKKSAVLMKKYYPQTEVKCCDGRKHTELAVYEPAQWCSEVGAFLRRNAS